MMICWGGAGRRVRDAVPLRDVVAGERRAHCYVVRARRVRGHVEQCGDVVREGDVSVFRLYLISLAFQSPSLHIIGIRENRFRLT